MTDRLAAVIKYHDGTKHHYHAFARSLGYLDWASQPRPFRSFDGSRQVPLFPTPAAEALIPAPSLWYDSLYDGPRASPLPVDTPAIGFFLRHALGLSAWKAFASSRWSLRVNPSSGNLHPTEAYVISRDRLWHYAADKHALEERCVFDPSAWAAIGLDPAQSFLVALTSIHWREAWKYGERAFRYCQHDLGHAIGALSLSSALCGWRLTMLPSWTHRDVAGLTGIDRQSDFTDAESEDPACVLLIAADRLPTPLPSAESRFLASLADGRWSGRASQLSEDHVQWTFIDEVAAATSHPVTPGADPQLVPQRPRQIARPLDAAAVILQRRSAVAFDGQSALSLESFLHMLRRVMPGAGTPWDALWWSPRIHLVLFVHRVTGLDPGIYLLARDAAAEPLLRTAITRDFSWHAVEGDLPLWRVMSGDHRRLAQRVSCDQDIAADGFFSLGMLADFDGSLRDHGPAFYRHLFWESGVVGQVLYLEAEAAGVRATGIGCFYDDGVHDVLGIADHSLQSLYHFTVGMPVEDHRLTTEAGYSWG